MKTIQFILIVILCALGMFINRYVPNDWQYLWGFVVATSLSILITNIMKRNGRKEKDKNDL